MAALAPAICGNAVPLHSGAVSKSIETLPLRPVAVVRTEKSWIFVVKPNGRHPRTLAIGMTTFKLRLNQFTKIPSVADLRSSFVL
jgi:hypothetical protein